MTTYQSRPLLDTRPDFQNVEAGLLDDFTYDMQNAGRGTPWKVTAGPRRTISYDFALSGRSTIGAFRKFFSDQRGRRVGFWLPVYLLDYALTATASAGDTVITIKNVGLASALVSFSQFGYLVLTNWVTTEAAKISSVVASGGTETITLTAPLANTWAAGRTTCGGLIIARPVDDEIDYSFQNLDYCRSTVKFTELPAEYASAAAGSAPIYLYQFTRGASTWRYADCGIDLVISSNTWKAADITHGDITAGLEFISEAVEFRVATDDSTHPLRACLDRNLLQETLVTIYETDLDTLALDTSSPVYLGRIENAKAGAKGLLTCNLSSILRVSEFTGPKPQMQRLCNHAVYDAGCTLNEASFRHTSIISGVSLDPIYIDTHLTTFADPNYYALGKVAAGPEIRLCVGQSGQRLYLNAPFKFAGIGDSITATAGCDRRVGTCNTKFSNVANFLGCPYLPNQTPQFEALLNPKPSGGKK